MSRQFPILAQVTVTTAGTAVQYTEDKVTNAPGAPGVGRVPLLVKRIEFRALPSNTGNILIGFNQRGALVKPFVLTATSFPLIMEAHDNGGFDINDFYIDATVSGEKVMIAAVPFRR